MNDLKILFEDNHLLVIFKPPGLLSQSDITGDEDVLTVLKRYLKEKYHKPGNVYLGLVHRLDRVTCGVMVFAKTSKAAGRLSEQIRNHQFQKDYLAVVHGHPHDDTYIDYLKKVDDFKTIVDSQGQYAELSFENLENHGQFSLLNVHLKTGRHHQIRVQFASRGYPLQGDHRYGNDHYPDLALCCYHLSFNHPITHEKKDFTYYPVGLNWNFQYLKNKR